MLWEGGGIMRAPIRELKVDRLNVKIYPDRAALGKAAGLAAAARIRAMQLSAGYLNLAFAAAPSQQETLEALRGEPGVDWSRIDAFHLDEYLGLPAGAPQWAECERYSRLLEEHPLDMALLGIGEYGHVAFNDPGAADFQDPLRVKVVALDDVCRLQQVNDGLFGSLEEVPIRAITLTIPALFSARAALVTVPSGRKAEAVRRTLRGPLDASCPATVLRGHPNVCLFLDRDSASLL
jgi:glucosamine-6-phosphate deaminase